MPPASWIWKHLTKTDDGKILCKHCKKTMSIKGGTTTLKYHLVKTHSISAPEEETGKLTITVPVAKPSSSQSSSGDTCLSATNEADSSQHQESLSSDGTAIEVDTSCRDASGRMVTSSNAKAKGAKMLATQGQSILTDWISVSSKRPCSATRAAELTKMALRCVTEDLQPLSFCEDSAMRGMLLFMEPNYQPPTHKTMSHHLMKLYDVKRDVLMSQLKGTEMSITVDGWTNSKMVGFFSVMGHYVSNDWEMKYYNLDSPWIDGRHTGENLSEAIDATLQEWEISCFTCVHDTASNMNKGLRLSKSVLYDFGCMAHILQLAVNDALKECNGGQAAALIGKVRDVVKFQGKSENFSREIRKYRDQLLPLCSKRELQIDCDTRWNSMCMMLESFLTLQTAIDLAVKSVCKADNKKKFYFSPEEINLLTDIVALLDNLKKTTDQWQGQKFVTSSTVYPVIFVVIERMEKLKLCSDAKKLKKALISNVKERLSMDDDMFLGSMSIPMIASYLDPRFKKLSFVTKEIADSIKEIIREEIGKLDVAAGHSACADTPSPSKRSKSFLEELFDGGDEIGETENDELAEYDKFRVSKITDDPLKWWRDHDVLLPKLAKLARRYLAVPATSASSERLFSTFGLVYEQRRMSLAKETAAAIVFMHENSVL